MTRSRLALTTLLLMAVLGSTGTALASDAAAIFKGKCAVCHGVNGSGDTPMGKKLSLRPLGSPAVQGQSDAVLLTTLSKGKGKMPAYGGKISDDDLKALVAHIRTFASK